MNILWSNPSIIYFTASPRYHDINVWSCVCILYYKWHTSNAKTCLYNW